MILHSTKSSLKFCILACSAGRKIISQNPVTGLLPPVSWIYVKAHWMGSLHAKYRNVKLHLNMNLFSLIQWLWYKHKYVFKILISLHETRDIKYIWNYLSLCDSFLKSIFLLSFWVPSPRAQSSSATEDDTPLFMYLYTRDMYLSVTLNYRYSDTQ
jgi:hypothetical protein